MLPLKPEEDVLGEIQCFFNDIFEMKEKTQGYFYATYKAEWLNKLGLSSQDSDEAKSSRTTKQLQARLREKFGDRLKTEAPVAEGMIIKFATGYSDTANNEVDVTKLQAFDVLDLETGTAFEISLSDAFAEVFKDILKSLLDSRVKGLYICMRNHNYKGSKKSGYLKVKDSPMVQQYINLAKLHKLDIYLVDLFPKCNERPIS